jgi:hypothetical protein
MILELFDHDVNFHGATYFELSKTKLPAPKMSKINGNDNCIWRHSYSPPLQVLNNMQVLS